ncbi:MAG TPA: hypothetical protein VFI02_07235 [Armatimonadota bacterium]|nr:hypothetical protein [Armatimonadota bacterium]
MKRRAALFLATIALLFLGCVPIDPPVVEPPEPPILTMRQQQKLLMEGYKETGFMPRGGGYYVLVEEKP